MKKLTILFCLSIFMFTSCGDENTSSLKRSSQYELEPDIEGIYVREFSNEVKNMSTGKVVGNVIVRDTIFIKVKENGYEVSNSKYKFNDYDQFGWTSIGGARKLPTFQATFDKSDSSLIPVQNQFVSTIYVDVNNKKIYKESGKENPYQKIE